MKPLSLNDIMKHHKGQRIGIAKSFGQKSIFVPCFYDNKYDLWHGYVRFTNKYYYPTTQPATRYGSGPFKYYVVEDKEKRLDDYSPTKIRLDKMRKEVLENDI